MGRRKRKIRATQEQVRGGGAHATSNGQAMGWGWLVLLVPGVCAGVYASSFSGLFLLDDFKHLASNKAAMLSGDWLSMVLSSARPVVSLSLWFNYATGGEQTAGYHLFNLLIHLAATVALFGVVFETMRNNVSLNETSTRCTQASAACWASVIALLWCVHPLQTGSVTYVAQRAESMMGLFYLLTLYCVVRGVRSTLPRRRRWWYGAAIAACALGMGCKAVMVTAPLVIFIYDRIFLTSSWRATISQRKGLYAGLAATWSVLFLFGVAGNVLFDGGGEHAAAGFSVNTVTPWEYARTQPGVIVHYLRLSVWPVGQCLDYQWPVADTGSVSKVWLPAALLGMLVICTGIALVRQPRIGFLGVWFIVILSPTSSFVPIMDLAFEHRMYLPLAAVIAGAILVLKAMIGRFNLATPHRTIVGIMMVLIATGGLSYATVQRNKLYADDIAMWKNVVATSPRNGRAYGSLGFALSKVGRIEDAVKAYEAAILVDADDAAPYVNLGNALFKLKRLQASVDAYDHALALDANLLHGHFGRAQTLTAMQRTAEAVDAYEQVLKLDPNHITARSNLGVALHRLRKYDASIAAYEEVLRRDPRNVNTQFNLGLAYHAKGRMADAEKQYRATLRLAPDHIPAKRALASMSGGG